MTRRLRMLLLFFVFCTELTVARSGAAQDEPARPDAESAESRALELYQHAELEYREGRFPEALALLERALALHDVAELHYNLGRVLQELGRWEQARDAYQAFLERQPDSPLRRRVESSITVMERRLLATDRVGEGGAGRIAAQPAPAPERPRAPSAWPWAVVALGGAALVAGAVSGGLFLSANGEVEDPTTPHEDAVDARQRAGAFASAANVSLVVGGVIAIAGLIWGLADLLNSD